MCHGYHSHLTRAERAEILKRRKQHLEDRIKQVEKELNELENVPNAIPQNA